MKNVKVVDIYFERFDNKILPKLQPEMRRGPKDRRKTHTYIANDRRSGIADRRRRPVITLGDLMGKR